MTTLTHLRQLLAAADPLPWHEVLGSFGKVRGHDDDNGRVYVKFENRDLIAAAVNALPALLRVVEAAELAEREMAKLMTDYHAPVYRGMDLIRQVQPLLATELAALDNQSPAQAGAGETT